MQRLAGEDAAVRPVRDRASVEVIHLSHIIDQECGRTCPRYAFAVDGYLLLRPLALVMNVLVEASRYRKQEPVRPEFSNPVQQPVLGDITADQEGEAAKRGMSDRHIRAVAVHSRVSAARVPPGADTTVLEEDAPIRPEQERRVIQFRAVAFQQADGEMQHALTGECREAIRLRAWHGNGEMAVVLGIADVHEAGQRRLRKEHDVRATPGRIMRLDFDLGQVRIPILAQARHGKCCFQIRQLAHRDQDWRRAGIATTTRAGRKTWPSKV